MPDLLTEAKSRVDVLRTQVGTGPVQISAADIELIDSLRAQLVDIRALHDGEKRQNATLKRQLTLRQQEIDQLEAAVGAKGGEISQAEDRARDQVESIRQEMTAAYDKLDATTTELEDIRRQKADLAEEITQLRSQLETREYQLNSRRENGAQLRESWFAMKQERDGLTQKLEEKERQLEGANQRINEVIEQRVQELAEAERRYADLESRLTEGALADAIDTAKSLTAVGHGIVHGDKVSAGARNWADSAYETLEIIAALK